MDSFLSLIIAVLWRTSGDCENYGILSGHKGAVLDLQWSRDSRVIYSASADLHVASWDVETGQRIRKHPGHEEVINCLDVSKRGEEILFTASDDGCIAVSDCRICIQGKLLNGNTDLGPETEGCY